MNGPEIKTSLEHEANGTTYKVNTVWMNGSAVAHVVYSSDGVCKTYEENDNPADSAYNKAVSHFMSISGWTNHGK